MTDGTHNDTSELARSLASFASSPHLAPFSRRRTAGPRRRRSPGRSRQGRGRPPSTRALGRVLLAFVEQSRLHARGSRAGSPRARARERAHPRVGLSRTAPPRSGTRAAPAPAGRPRRPLDLEPVHHARRREGDDVLDLVAELVRQPLLQRRQVARLDDHFASMRVPGRRAKARARRRFRGRARASFSSPPSRARRCRRYPRCHSSERRSPNASSTNTSWSRRSPTRRSRSSRGTTRGLELRFRHRHLGGAQHAVARVEGEHDFGPVPGRGSVTGGSPTRRLSRAVVHVREHTHVRGVRVVQRHHLPLRAPARARVRVEHGHVHLRVRGRQGAPRRSPGRASCACTEARTRRRTAAV